MNEQESESAHSDYEEDFEDYEEPQDASHPSPPADVEVYESSPAISQASKPPIFKKQPSVSSIRSRSQKPALSKDVELRRLQQENQSLRGQLKELNNRLSDILDQHKQKKRPISTESKKETAQKEQAKTSTKQVNIYRNEYQKLKARLEKLEDFNYLSSLKKEIEAKQEKVKKYEKQTLQMKTNQRSRGKNLAKLYYEEELPDNIKASNDLINEDTTLKNMVAVLEEKIEKQQEHLQALQEREYELVDQKESLEELASRYGITVGKKTNSKVAKKHQMLVKQIETIHKQGEATASHLKTVEYSAKSKLEQSQKEYDGIFKEYQKKKEALAQVSTELEEIMQVASAKNLHGLISQFKTSDSRKSSAIATPKAAIMSPSNSSKGRPRVNSREIRERARIEIQQQDAKTKTKTKPKNNPLPVPEPKNNQPPEEKNNPPVPEVKTVTKNKSSKFNFKAALNDPPALSSNREEEKKPTENNFSSQPNKFSIDEFKNKGPVDDFKGKEEKKNSEFSIDEFKTKPKQEEFTQPKKSEFSIDEFKTKPKQEEFTQPKKNEFSIDEFKTQPKQNEFKIDDLKSQPKEFTPKQPEALPKQQSLDELLGIEPKRAPSKPDMLSSLKDPALQESTKANVEPPKSDPLADILNPKPELQKVVSKGGRDRGHLLQKQQEAPQPPVAPQPIIPEEPKKQDDLASILGFNQPTVDSKPKNDDDFLSGLLGQPVNPVQSHAQPQVQPQAPFQSKPANRGGGLDLEEEDLIL